MAFRVNAVITMPTYICIKKHTEIKVKGFGTGYQSHTSDDKA